jgi:putative ABC transport system substrate-binding protein
MTKRVPLVVGVFGVFFLTAVVAGYLYSVTNVAETLQTRFRIGILAGLSYAAAAADGFKAEMTTRGYIEGKNMVYDQRNTDFDTAAYQRILKQFVKDKVDLIFVFPTEASLEAKAVTQGTDIPVVFAFANIEGNNLVHSVREPGENITGVRYPGPDVALQRFEILRELIPGAKRMWVPYQRGYPVVESQLKVLRPAAAAEGITLLETPADNAAELEADLRTRTESGDIGLDVIALLLAEPLAVTPAAIEAMGKFAQKHKVPLGGVMFSAGGYESLFGVNVQGFNVGKQAAGLADRILKGTPAGTLPVRSAESYFELNYGLAEKTGIAVPEGLLNRAHRIER